MQAKKSADMVWPAWVDEHGNLTDLHFVNYICRQNKVCLQLVLNNNRFDSMYDNCCLFIWECQYKSFLFGCDLLLLFLGHLHGNLFFFNQKSTYNATSDATGALGSTIGTGHCLASMCQTGQLAWSSIGDATQLLLAVTTLGNGSILFGVQENEFTAGSFGTIRQMMNGIGKQSKQCRFNQKTLTFVVGWTGCCTTIVVGMWYVEPFFKKASWTN